MIRRAGITVRDVVRLAGHGVVVVLALAAALIPGEWWIGASVAAGFALSLHGVLAVESIQHRWWRSGVGREPGAGAFLRGNLDGLLLLGGTMVMLGGGFALWRTPLAGGARGVVANAALGGLVLFVGGLLLGCRRDGGEVGQLRRELPRTPVGALVGQALALQRNGMRGSFGMFYRLLLFVPLAGVVLAVVGGGVAWLGVELRGGWRAVAWGDPPLLLVVGVLGAACSLLLSAMTVLVTTCRVVEGARRGDGVPPRRLWAEVDNAVGKLGILATLVAGGFVLFLGAGFAFAGVQVASWVASAGAEDWLAALAGTAAALGALWALVLVPCVWLPAIMVDHDCGWGRGVMASAALTGVEGARTYRLAAVATLMGATVILLPAAAALVLLALEEMRPLVPLALGTAQVRDVRATVAVASVEGTREGRPKPLQRAYAALEEGRYLDAVNAFQMFTHGNFGNVDALRGECLAQLHLGNRALALERLERWALMEPENPEPAALLEELHQGRWSEGGDRHRAALARRTQDPGKGVTMHDTIAFDPGGHFGRKSG